ncbi:hypothetical protein [Actinomadura violacea]|uniref:Uncharacterized protein n=1 Tax=Actinomadura violacea TaxID=2819934 RepID=A0ABS3RU44_9ACTN|nr:hypothetical protein [Actinomadura violacea]MBO2460008.1 hypothetical protein [Actinomadura violacea]
MRGGIAMWVPSLRLVRLHLASRRAGLALVAIGAVALVIVLPIPRSGGMLGALVPLVVAMGAAAVVGAATASPIGEVERVTGRPLPALRGAAVLLMFGTAIALLAAAAAGRAPAGGSLPLLRACTGLTGITLLTAVAAGPQRSWTLPLAYTILCGHAIERSWRSLWFWPIRAGHDAPAATVAIALLLAGLLAIAVRGTRVSVRS